MRFEWDLAKARHNLAKHGVSFESASTAFGDPLSFTVFDSEHSDEEDRFALLGSTHSGRLVVVIHVYDSEIVRIISARLATKRERRTYANG